MVYNNHKLIFRGYVLDNQAYEALKSKDISQLECYILDILRDKCKTEEIQIYRVSIAFLAIYLSEMKSRNFVMKHIGKNLEDETTLIFLQKVLREFENEIKNVSKKFDTDCLKAAILFSDPLRLRDSEHHSTPEGISQLAISLLNLNNNDTILDLGSGVLSFLTEAAYQSASQKLYGVEINTSSVIVANMRRSLLQLPIQLTQGNMISQSFSNLSANKVFSDHPYGMRLSELKMLLSKNPLLSEFFNEEKRTVSGDWIYNMAAFFNMKPPGKTVVLMTNGGTWNKSDENIRKKLLEKGIIEAVILLPERLLTYSMIPLTMLVLSNNNHDIKMVDATQVYTEGRKQNSLEEKDVKRILEAYQQDTVISKTVPIDDIASQEYILNPKRYVGENIKIKNSIALGDVCIAINRGVMMKSSELDQLVCSEKTNFQYLKLQDIQNGFIEDDLPSLKSLKDEHEKYVIHDKNLIISKIFPFKIATAKIKTDEQLLASGNLYFLELDESKVNPVFVEVFLRSEAGMTQFNYLSKGTIMKSISIQDLKEIQIPNIPREEQDKIAKEYEMLSDEIIILQRQMEMVCDKRDRLIEGLII